MTLENVKTECLRTAVTTPTTHWVVGSILSAVNRGEKCKAVMGERDARE